MDPAQIMTAELVAIRFVLAAILGELLDGAVDRTAAVEILLRRALSAADGLRLEGATEHDACAMRDAVRQRVATLLLRDATAHRRTWWPAATAG
jgi:hypothetical protein